MEYRSNLASSLFAFEVEGGKRQDCSIQDQNNPRGFANMKARLGDNIPLGAQGLDTEPGLHMDLQ